MTICPVCQEWTREPHPHGIIGRLRSRAPRPMVSRRVSDLERGFVLGVLATLVALALAVVIVAAV